MVDWRTVGDYYVLYRLARQGYVCSPVDSGAASILACSEDGTRVALVVVEIRHGRQEWQLTADLRSARNVSYVFVDFTEDGLPPCSIVPSAVLAARLSHTRLDAEWINQHRDAWHALGLDLRLAHAS